MSEPLPDEVEQAIVTYGGWSFETGLREGEGRLTADATLARTNALHAVRQAIAAALQPAAPGVTVGMGDAVRLSQAFRASVNDWSNEAPSRYPTLARLLDAIDLADDLARPPGAAPGVTVSKDQREQMARFAFGTWHIATNQQPSLADGHAKGWSVVSAWYALSDQERSAWLDVVKALADDRARTPDADNESP